MLVVLEMENVLFTCGVYEGQRSLLARSESFTQAVNNPGRGWRRLVVKFNQAAKQRSKNPTLV